MAERSASLPVYPQPPGGPGLPGGGGTTRRAPRVAWSMAARTVLATAAETAAALNDLVAQAINEATAEKGAASVAVSGGSMNKMLAGLKDKPDVKWSDVHVYWADERCVPHDHGESNFGAANANWLAQVPIPKQNVHCVPANAVGDVDEAANAYDAVLRGAPPSVLPKDAEGTPQFDLLLLGFGPDGHTCSLFPGRPHMDDASDRAVLAVRDSPKPPPERVTITRRVCRAAKRIAFIGTGREKAPVVKACLADPACTLPAAVVTREAKSATWMLDSAAASEL